MDWPPLTPSLVLRLLCLAFVCGIGIHSLDERVWGATTWAALAAVFCITAMAIKKLGFWAVVCLAGAFAAAGIWRFDLSLSSADRLVVPTVRQEFSGQLSSAISDQRGQRLDLIVVRGADGTGYAPAELYVVSAVAYRIGDRISWTCQPREIRPAQSAFERRWSCRPTDGPQLVSASPFYSLGRNFDAVRSALRRAAGIIWPEPEASFILGLLTGDDSGLTARDRQSFRDAGLSHVLAASGFNVARVADAALIMLAVGSIRRRRAAVGAMVAVAFFAGLTGNAASAVRAALMGGLALLATALGKRYSSATALPLAAAVMLVFDPAALRHDLGFQLSFAAVWGLTAFGAAFEMRMAFLPAKFGLRRTAAETTAATVATLPLLLWAFGAVPLLTLPANLAVLPVIPWIMAIAAGTLACGALSSWFAQALSPLAWLPSAYAVRAAAFFASFSDASLRLAPGPFAVACLYSCLLLLSAALRRLDDERDRLVRLTARISHD